MSRARRVQSWHARLSQARAFFARDIWEARLDRLPPRKALRYRTARLVYRAVEGLTSDMLQVRAAALTYYTMLSLVPLLAFAFALLKGFGVYDALVQDTIQPFALRTFAGNPSLQDAVYRVLDFVGNTDVTSLGFVGLLLLLWAATRLLVNIELVLNAIWEAPRRRGPIQQLAHHLAIIVVVPLCLTLATVFGTLAQSISVLRALRERIAPDDAIEWTAATLGPLVIVFAALVFLYRVMPNTKVASRSAVLGAAAGSLLWYAALIVHVRFQVGMARFNALYAGFAALPIFVVWLHVSWLVVMVGASIGATHQHERSSTQRRRAARANPAMREALAVSALLSITRAFLSGAPPRSVYALADELDAPEPLLLELLQRVADAGLVVETGPGDEADPRFTLVRPPEDTRIKDVLDAVRGSAREETRGLGHERGIDPQTSALLLQLDEQIARSPHNRSLRELAEAGSADPHG